MENSDKIIIIKEIIKEIVVWVGIILAVYAFVLLPILAHDRKTRFENVSCCTIAYTNGIVGGRVREIEYVYYVNEILYKGTDGSGFNSVKDMGGKYLIKYVCDNPQDALIYFDKPIEGDTIPAEYLINKKR